MKVTFTQTGSELLVAIEGSINTMSAPELDKEVSGKLDGITSLILDFKNVDYISSAGLRVLLALYKAMSAKGGLILRNVCQDVMDVFTMTGFDNFLTIE
ncbi:MAG: STAS domain-containing protein [Bacilli bacterium]|nr:STAS domain-containing protein [Bacilli bacterium]